MFAHVRSAALLAVTLAGVVGAQAPIMATVTPLGPRSNSSLSGSAVSPDGRFTIMSNDSLVRLDLTTGKWATIGPSASAATWSGDGRFIAFTRSGDAPKGMFNWVMPMDPKTGLGSGVARRVSLRTGIWPAWSPDGRRIAFLSNDSKVARLVVAPFNGGADAVIMETPGRAASVPSWSRDGRFIYLTIAPPPPGRSVPSQLRTVRVNIASGAVDTLRSAGFVIGESKDGRYLAFHDSSGGVVVSLLSDPSRVQHVSAPPGIMFRGWSPVEPNQMIGIEDIVESNLHAVDLETGVVKEITAGKREDRQPSYSPDGKRIAYVSTLRGQLRVAISNADGSGERVIGTITSGSGALQWSPDGQQVAYFTNSPDAIRVADVATGRDREIVRVNPSTGARSFTLVVFAWRADSKAIRTVRKVGTAGRRAFVEATLDGKAVELAALADSVGYEFGFVSDSLLASQAGDRMQLVSVATGRIDRTFALPSGTTWDEDDGFAVSGDKQWVGVALRSTSSKPYTSTDPDTPYLLSLKTGTFRAIPNPFRGHIHRIEMDPAGRFMVVASQRAGMSPYSAHDIVQLPFNGDTPRVLSAKDGKFLDAAFHSVSPNGRTVLYDAETYNGTALYEITLPPFTPKKKP